MCYHDRRISNGGPMEPLKNARHEQFCREYLIDLNGAQAATRAGYSEKSARITSSKLLTNPNIQARISWLMEQRNRKVGVDSEIVLAYLVELATLNIKDIHDQDGNLLPLQEWPDAWARGIQGLETSQVMVDELPTLVNKFKMPDRLKAWELIGKHTDIQAFKPKGQEQVRIQLANVEKVLDLMASGKLPADKVLGMLETIINA